MSLIHGVEAWPFFCLLSSVSLKQICLFNALFSPEDSRTSFVAPESNAFEKADACGIAAVSDALHLPQCWCDIEEKF